MRKKLHLDRLLLGTYNWLEADRLINAKRGHIGQFDFASQRLDAQRLESRLAGAPERSVSQAFTPPLRDDQATDLGALRFEIDPIESNRAYWFHIGSAPDNKHQIGRVFEIGAIPCLLLLRFDQPAVVEPDPNFIPIAPRPDQLEIIETNRRQMNDLVAKVFCWNDRFRHGPNLAMLGIRVARKSR